MQVFNEFKKKKKKKAKLADLKKKLKLELKRADEHKVRHGSNEDTSKWST